MIRTLCNLLVVLACVLTLPACGKTGLSNPTGPSDPTPIPTPIPTPTPEPTPTPTPAVTVTSLALTGRNVDFHTTSVEVGKSEPLKVMATFSDGNVADVTSEAVCTSSNEAIATAQGCSVTGMSVGPVTIRAMFGDRTARADIMVSPLSASTTTISGTVWCGTESSAFRVPGAQIDVFELGINQALNNTTTNSRGEYTLSGITLTTFKVRYSTKSFSCQTVEKEWTLRLGTVIPQWNVLMARK